MAETNDPLDGLEERLKNHSRAFESLLALTPAQEYYGTSIADGRDPNDQWKAKKQTKAEQKAARQAKLDPANQKSALDIMKEREKKRKRDLGMASDDENDGEDESTEVQKKMKVQHETAKDESESTQNKVKTAAEKHKLKRERKKAKKEASKAKEEAKELKKQQKKQKEDEAAVNEDNDIDGEDNELDVDVDGMVEDESEIDGFDDMASSAPSSPRLDSPVFDVSANHSTTSSSTSIVPPSATDKTSVPNDSDVRPSLSIQLPRPASASTLLQSAESSSKVSSPKPQLPKIDQAVLQERLRVRLAELRQKRKADGADGQPARSRQELLEQRRKKAEQKKAQKKAQRRAAKEEEARKQEEQLRGSGSPLSGADIFSPRNEANSFSFSRMAFADGSATDASMTKLMDAPKQKGPSDAKTALLAAENKQKRLSGFDEQKRADIGEKDLWLNAKKRAQGERVRDDTSLLKKALKRKEKQKSKSEKEWQEREAAVVHGKEMRQKKREENLAKRKEEKGGGNKKKKPKSKKRPGFEGTFRA